MTLARELAVVLNKHCCENDSNTPDYILAKFLLGCLRAFGTATKEREEWSGMRMDATWPQRPIRVRKRRRA